MQIIWCFYFLIIIILEYLNIWFYIFIVHICVNQILYKIQSIYTSIKFILKIIIKHKTLDILII